MSNQFRLLSYAEYLKLPATEKTRYLAMVSQELEHRQRKIREQMEQFTRKQHAKD